MKKKEHYQQIAEEVTKETATGSAIVTAAQVEAIAAGTDVCYSHPVNQAVVIKLRERKLI